LKLPDIVLSPLGTREDGECRQPQTSSRRCAFKARCAGSWCPKDREQQHSADGRHDDRKHVEALLVPEAQKARKDEAAQKGADDADEEIGEQTLTPACHALGEPAGEDGHHDPRKDAHDQSQPYWSANVSEVQVPEGVRQVRSISAGPRAATAETATPAA
jgi:hypothetical protein